MKHGLMHPDLYFDAWASPASAWKVVEQVVRGLRSSRGNAQLYTNLEWLARRADDWPGHAPHRNRLAANSATGPLAWASGPE
jgi:hypothetical protein